MEKFNNDLTLLDRLSQSTQAQDRPVFEALSANRPDGPYRAIDAFLNACDLPLNAEHRLAAARRLYMLREDGLLQVFKTRWPDRPDRQNEARNIAREAARTLHETRLKTLLDEVESKSLLSPFYRAVIRGMHQTGLAFNAWHPRWLEAIGASHRFIETAAGGAQNAAAWLAKNHLYDPADQGAQADRCYSVLDERGTVLTYAQAFKREVAAVINALGVFESELDKLEDPHFNEKRAWLDWIGALKAALAETDRGQTLLRWRAVDRAWMAIGGPIQPGHPLEYYEDRYRCAVAPEWDLRLSLPASSGGSPKTKIAQMARGVYGQTRLQGHEATLRHAENSLQKTRLFMGRPLLFYGALLDGLFSAQVVPNDEQVSRECGKKIFAFADAVLQTAQMRPKMRLETEIFEPEFLARYRFLVHDAPDRWRRVYDIETVGHELGHVLWVDENTETAMNGAGVFKLIEEFKATAGGLMAFFSEEHDAQTLQDLAVAHIKRAVELIGWRESAEVAAYYHEALIHLSGLFESGAIRFDGERLKTDLTPATLAALKDWYRATYADLAAHYLQKRPAEDFLTRFVQNDLPKSSAASAFVVYYWQRWQAIGREVAKEGLDAA